MTINELIKLMEDINIKKFLEMKIQKTQAILLKKCLFSMNNKKVEDSKY